MGRVVAKGVASLTLCTSLGVEVLYTRVGIAHHLEWYQSSEVGQRFDPPRTFLSVKNMHKLFSRSVSQHARV